MNNIFEPEYKEPISKIINITEGNHITSLSEENNLKNEIKDLISKVLPEELQEMFDCVEKEYQKVIDELSVLNEEFKKITNKKSKNKENIHEIFEKNGKDYSKHSGRKNNFNRLREHLMEIKTSIKEQLKKNK